MAQFRPVIDTGHGTPRPGQSDAEANIDDKDPPAAAVATRPHTGLPGYLPVLPHIPGRLVRTLPEDRRPPRPHRTAHHHPVQRLVRFDTQGEHEDRLASTRRQIIDNLRPDHMVRFDFCAPIEVKFRLGSGMPDFHPDMTQLVLDDPRPFDILCEFPREAVPIWQRPWVPATIIDGYPVEYRAFVRNGDLLGIS